MWFYSHKGILGKGRAHMRIFDTKVQHLKYKVLRSVARHAWNGTLEKSVLDIPKEIVSGNKPTMSCCVYKERAVMAERVKIAMGGDPENKNIIEVIDIACDECPATGLFVTNNCRGCLAHRCEDVCPRGAIVIDDDHKAHIDKEKCISCGLCAKACPYSAIAKHRRPCEAACKVKAISMSKNSETKEAVIDENKCIGCGACVYQCPFGAISDKSFILDVIDILKKSNNNENYRVHAIVAPSIIGQFRYAKLGQVLAGIQALGFHKVTEVALGADMVAAREGMELLEKQFLISSCCPSFVDFVRKNFPKLAPHISENISPMGAIAQYIKQQDPTAKIVFIGPCTAKKMEIRQERIRPLVDSVITFEELQALFDSRDLDITAMEEAVLDDASYFGRVFARSGGLTEAIRQALKELGENDFQLKPATCNGIEACRVALLKAAKGQLDENFIEGMACEGGCIGGAGCLTHRDKNRLEVDNFSREVIERNIGDAVRVTKHI